MFLNKEAVGFILTISVITPSLGRIGRTDDAVDRGNDFVDKLLLDMVQENGEEYDPYVVENSTVGFHKVIIVNISGEATLFDGYMRGLKSLHRADNCYLTEEGETLRIRADLGAGVIDLHYAGTVKFMTYGPTVNVLGKVPYMEIIMEMTVNANDGKDGKLEKFYIEDIRGMQVWITGLGPLNWAINSMISAVSIMFRGFIHRAVESKIESHIADRIQNYQFPVNNKF